MADFNLKISLSGRTEYEGKCSSLDIPTPEGHYGIMAHHSPVYAAIVPGKIKYTVDGEDRFFETGGAILSFCDNEALILSE